MGNFEDELVSKGFLVVKAMPPTGYNFNIYPTVRNADFVDAAKAEGIKVIYHYDMTDLTKMMNVVVDREAFLFSVGGMVVSTHVEGE
jgi:hypothetical protein